MKTLEFFCYGKRLKDVYPHATFTQVCAYRVRRLSGKMAVTAIYAGSVYLSFLAGEYQNKGELHYKAAAISGAGVVEAAEVEAGLPPVMQRIMDCESGGRMNGKPIEGSATHYDSNGQVLMRSNNNHSVDIGIAQINTVWFEKASELNLDVTKEEDNVRMALWIYENRGTGDWYSSESCWRY